MMLRSGKVNPSTAIAGMTPGITTTKPVMTAIRTLSPLNEVPLTTNNTVHNTTTTTAAAANNTNNTNTVQVKQKKGSGGGDDKFSHLLNAIGFNPKK